MSYERKELKAVFRGRVQGVGFRWTVLAEALNRNLSGTVQNLPNGSVELYLQGTEDELFACVESIKKKSGFAKIKFIEQELHPIRDKKEGFHILF